MSAFRRWRTVLLILPLLMLLALSDSRRLVAAAQTPPGQTVWPTAAWPDALPEQYGFDSAKAAEALLTIHAENLNIHSLLVIRDGRLLLDAAFYPYDGSSVHELASVTKTITTTLVGIAAGQGLLGLDQPVMSFFPERIIANRDERKERITVRHLAGMSSGLQCTPEQDERTLDEMWASPDWIQFVLDLPVMLEPGSRFIYCSPGSHVLSAVLQQATGMTELEFARANVFAPLGIRDVIWPADPQGYTYGWGDVYLRPRDAAKLGYLWLHGGMWEDQQVVPREWVEAAVQVHQHTGENDDYGYGWWVTPNTPFGYEYQAIGRGGQRVIVLPALDLIIVTTGGGLNPDAALGLIAGAFVSPAEPLPANPEGLARLNAVLPALTAPPVAVPAPPLPELARTISGTTYRFDANPTGIATLRLDFDESAEAQILVAYTSDQTTVSGPVGLDGVFRFSPWDHGLPAGLRGAWLDPTTFLLELEGIANRDAYRVRTLFAGDTVSLEIRERTRTDVVRVEGRR